MILVIAQMRDWSQALFARIWIFTSGPFVCLDGLPGVAQLFLGTWQSRSPHHGRLIPCLPRPFHCLLLTLDVLIAVALVFRS